MNDVLTRLTDALEGRYRIVREAGVGGMATVYLAHDIRHERDVAIKVLHPDLAAALGAERFLTEIKTTAKLQHPHILPLLDSGDADGLLFYVMPYVAGESLRARLDRETQLGVDDAVRITREAASALDYAHRHGVVHRDVKPENILIHEEQALVADFGIALAVSAAGGPRMTQTGLSLGTPAYMAPEQAMGERAIDGRADIYALGAVLYEMLVGEAPFTGPTVQAIVARVMTESPRPLTGQRKSVPAHVNAAVLHALQKLPADRFHTAAEFSQALSSPGFQSFAGSDQALATSSRVPRWIRTPLLPWAVAALGVIAALYFAVSGGTSSGDETRPTFVSLDLPQKMELVPYEAEGMSISHDGQSVVIGGFIDGRSQLVLRRLDTDAVIPINGSLDAQGPADFSPDDKWLTFAANRRLYKVLASGGTAIPIASAPWGHVAWVNSNTIVYTSNYNTGLSRMSADGRDSSTLTQPDRTKQELGHWWPQALPDGDHVLFTVYTTPADRSTLEVISLRTGARQQVLKGGYYGRYSNGYLLYISNGSLMAVAFDPKSLKSSGGAMPLPLDVEVNPPNGWAGFASSDNGTLAYRTDALKAIDLTWMDRNGNEEPAIEAIGSYSDALPSPDNRKIALVRDGDVWVYDRPRHLFTRLTTSEQRETSLIWTPDSRQVVYSRDVPQYDIFMRLADGSGEEQRVATSSFDKRATSFTPDGRMLLYISDEGGSDDLYIRSLTPGDSASVRKVITGPGAQIDASFSPDGKWIVYSSNESGRVEIYLAPYPLDRGPGRQQLSNRGGSAPRWRPDGRAIYYADPNGQMTEVEIAPGTGEPGRSAALSRIRLGLSWTIASDGRFLIQRVAKNAERHSIRLLFNWTSLLERKQ